MKTAGTPVRLQYGVPNVAGLNSSVDIPARARKSKWKTTQQLGKRILILHSKE